MKKKYKVIDCSSDEVLYTLKKKVKKKTKDRVYTLSFSNAPEWREAIRGEKILTIIDDGNGLKIISNEERLQEDITLSYSFVEELRVLLNFIHNDEDFVTDNRYKILPI